MKIKNITINNYRAFYGEYKISLNGKNALIYGENGSGKSSLYNALKDVFETSVSSVVLNENIFVDSANKDSVFIEVDFFNKLDKSLTKSIRIDRNILTTTETLVADANKIKAFFDYKKLLATHFVNKIEVDIFDILINDILYYSINSFSNKTLGKEWEEINELKKARNGTSRANECKDVLKNFNMGLREKLETIKDNTNRFIDYFGYGIKIDFQMKDIEIYGKQKEIKYNEVILKVDFFDKPIDKHHTFFNEARLTALGISLYLSSILSNPLDIDFKIMFLDDVLIGLDMSNRIPFINILKDHFQDFQLFITTYDKAWFELLKSYLNEREWNYLEIYSKNLLDGFEAPVIYSNDLIQKSKDYLSTNDYKASAVYIRSAFEKIVKDYCHKNGLKVKFSKQPFRVDINHFWESIVKNTTLKKETVEKIELYRSIVMNPISHHTLEKPEFKTEIQNTISAVMSLSDDLKNAQIVDPLRKLEEEKKELEKIIDGINISDNVGKLNIFDILSSIDNITDLNSFLRNEILDNIDNFSNNELEKIFDELRMTTKIKLLDIESESILIRIFTTKTFWTDEEKKIWCNFVQYLYEQNKIKEPLFIKKLEEKNVLCLERDQFGNEFINCNVANDMDVPF